MIRTVEAVVDGQGRVLLLGKVHVQRSCRALVTILEDEPAHANAETTLLSDAALAADWCRPEEDEAWSHLQR
jgi:hypothetical protein